jgi:hypothetical protein
MVTNQDFDSQDLPLTLDHPSTLIQLNDYEENEQNKCSCGAGKKHGYKFCEKCGEMHRRKTDDFVIDTSELAGKRTIKPKKDCCSGS